MNLHAIVRSAISSVNPDVPVTVAFSLPPTTAPTGKRTATYSAPVPMMAQVQALTSTDLRKMEGQNIQGATRSIYLYGTLDGVSRMKQKGGDLVTLPGGVVYLTTMVLEQWPDWVKVSATAQMDGV